MEQVFDVAIIGGGINGSAAAADAALRGLSVILLEKDDLASKTSSSSTKLIHGGLRYLEQLEFKLVKKALTERQRLLGLAPHLVHPQELVIPHQKDKRYAWLLKLGLFIYDNLSSENKLPKFKSIRRNHSSKYFLPLKKEIQQAFSFYDASTDDARLTIVNCLQAKNHGACIRPHTLVTSAKAINKQWQLTVAPKVGPQYTVFAKTLINAAGPWVKHIEAMTKAQAKSKAITLVKGSHIIVPQLYEGAQGYLLQHEDNRIVFVIPYYGFSMIGTTDVAFEGDLENLSISGEEIDYLTTLVSAYFKTEVKPSEVLYSWSGLRPLVAQNKKEMRAISRDYDFELSLKPAPLVTIYSGKITTYRVLAEEVINAFSSVFPQLNKSKTGTTPLPGATFGPLDFNQYQEYAKEKYPWLAPCLLNRYLNAYGSNTELFLSSCTNYESMGLAFGKSLYQVEVDYLVQQEWAKDKEDILTRRTKLILEMGLDDQQKLEAYLKLSASCNSAKDTQSNSVPVSAL